MTEVIIKTGKEYMDVKMIHRYLSEDSYWAKGISYELVEHSLDHSFCAGAFVGQEQIGFGRVITDYYTFGWFADFFVLSPFRGQGISKKLLSHIFDQPWSKRLRRQMLNTSDAHGLYTQFGFTSLANPTYLMEVYRPTVHLEYKENR